MANFVDEFVGTAGTLLTAHTSDSGHTWTVPSGGTSWTIGPSGESYSAPTFTTRCFPTALPASADFTVSAKFKRITDLASINAGISVRSTDGSNLHGYYLRFIRSTNLWRVDLINEGVVSILGSVAATITNGQVYQLELSAIGSTITGKVDGVTIWTGVNTIITAAGKGGIIAGGAASSATTGIHLNDFSMTDASFASSAGVDQSNIEPYDTVTLTGTGAAATWSQTGGSPTVTLGGSGSTRTFEAPATLEGTTLTFSYGGDSMNVQILQHNEWKRNPADGTRIPIRITSRL